MLEAARKLTDEVDAALNLALSQSAKEKHSLVVRKTSARLWVVDFLFGVELHIESQKFILERMFFGWWRESARDFTSVGAFIVTAGSLSGATKASLEIVDRAKVLGEDKLADYFMSLYDGLLNTALAIKKSRPVSSGKKAMEQQFCSLCWRLVHIFGKKYYSVSEGYSSHYCEVHHPKLQTKVYHRARRCVLSAAKARSNKEDVASLSAYESCKKKKQMTTAVLYRLTSGFAPTKTDSVSALLKETKVCWKEKAKQLMEIIEATSPQAFSKIRDANLRWREGWKEWHLSVVAALDDTDTDQQCWKEARDFENPPHEYFDNYNNGLRAALTICYRYEAVKIIESFARPRGPKKGKVAKNSSVRLRLKHLALERKENNMPVVWSHIAKELGISRARVSVLAKELKLL